MDNYGYVIVNHIGKRALLEQMAEEASELAQAALKLIRAEYPENPTPIDETQAIANLVEEYTDVVQCAEYLRIYPDKHQMRAKAQRWAQRIGCAEKAHDYVL